MYGGLAPADQGQGGNAVAHRRDVRRLNYMGVVETYFSKASGPPAKLKKFAKRASESCLDEVLYDPRRLVCAPQGETLITISDPIVAAVHSIVNAMLTATPQGPYTQAQEGPAAEKEGSLPTFDPRINDQAEGEWEQPRTPLGLAEGQRLVFDLPEAVDSVAVAQELEADERFTGRSAPVYYALSQQTAQPGEDPEEGSPVMGLPPLLGEDGPADPLLGRGVTVAVIDTGIQALRGTLLRGYFSNQFEASDVDDVRDPETPSFLGPAAGHGTFIAGLIHCVAPGALVRSYLVANSLGFCDEEEIARAIDRAVADFNAKKGGAGHDDALVINLSLGGYPFAGQSGLPHLLKFAVLEAAIARVPGTVAIVAAAGNCGSSDEFFPAAFKDVTGVAALDDCRHDLWAHSNYGDWVNACARGVNLRGLFVEGDENPVYDTDKRPETWNGAPSFATWSGTSFAAPLVAAQIAIVAAELGTDARQAGQKLLNMSKVHPGSRPCGKRILVDLPGQT